MSTNLQTRAWRAKRSASSCSREHENDEEKERSSKKSTLSNSHSYSSYSSSSSNNDPISKNTTTTILNHGNPNSALRLPFTDITNQASENRTLNINAQQASVTELLHSKHSLENQGMIDAAHPTSDDVVSDYPHARPFIAQQSKQTSTQFSGSSGSSSSEDSDTDVYDDLSLTSSQDSRTQESMLNPIPTQATFPTAEEVRDEGNHRDSELKNEREDEGSASDSSHHSSASEEKEISEAVNKYWLETSADDMIDEYSVTLPFVNENKYRADPNYMDSLQTDLAPHMRTILAGWLIEVAEEYALSDQTLLLSISYIDRFLSIVPVDRSRLQLIGATALVIASKFWEMKPLTPEDMVYISDNTFKKEEVIGTERIILTSLHYSLNVVTPIQISERFGAHVRATRRCEALTSMLINILLMQPSYLQFMPSSIAFSALLLAVYTIGECAISRTPIRNSDTFHSPTLSKRIQLPEGTVPQDFSTLAPHAAVPSHESLVSPNSFTMHQLSSWLHHFRYIVEMDIDDCTRCLNEIYRLYLQNFSVAGRVASWNAHMHAIHDKYGKPEYGYVSYIMPRAFPRN